MDMFQQLTEKKNEMTEKQVLVAALVGLILLQSVVLRNIFKLTWVCRFDSFMCSTLLW